MDRRNRDNSSATNKPQQVNLLGANFATGGRYEIIDIIGSGAYGVVVSARDTTTGERVAIKKIEKAFEHPTFTKRTLRELKILRLLDHENIMKVRSILLPSNRDDFEEIYVICELLETDLSSIIKSPQSITDEHCQFFLYQILIGVKYMASACILHRDLKPRNLLVNSNCDLKICDFGLARPYINNLRITSAQMTDYVATRWYRAPEVLLACRKYSSAMDMWSVGCIFAELLLRRPLLPGNDSNHQLELIFNLLGTPNDEDIEAIPNQKSKEKLATFSRREGKSLQVVFRNSNPDAVDLLKRMLVFNPDKRISVEDALAHPYLSTFHCEEDEPVSDPVSIFDFQFEEQNLSIRELKSLIYEEILLYHNADFKERYNKAKEEYVRNSPAENRARSSGFEEVDEEEEVN
ncbi:unnamed protein product [Blepharisma stoltei]|uniref:Mitogen-activated protein kinase n=1 Tax=Blepharisma stoltei TaxID=1481888 RepID=A0AAU9J6I7_9CILI|nr:unnamed protein product [Blepharisma stoltei]